MQFSRFLRRVPVTLGFRRCKSSAGRGTSARPWPMTSRWVAAVDVVDMEPRTKHGSFHSVSIVFVVDVRIFGWVMWVYTYYIRIHFFACDASIPIFGVLTYPSITSHAWFYPTPCLMISHPLTNPLQSRKPCWGSWTSWGWTTLSRRHSVTE